MGVLLSEVGAYILGGEGAYKRNKTMSQNKLITKHTLFHYKTKFETLTLTVAEHNKIRSDFNLCKYDFIRQNVKDGVGAYEQGYL